MHKFQIQKHDDLAKTFDDMLDDYGTAAKSVRSKQETLLGFSLDPDGLLASGRARDMLCLDKVLFDLMHCYYGKGITAQEVNLLSDVLKERFGISIAHCTDTAVRHGCRLGVFDTISESNVCQGLSV